MKIYPYLHFPGTCEEAMNFYRTVLGGEMEMMLPHEGTEAEGHVPPEWTTKIMHACLRVSDDVRLMASDAPPQYQQKVQGFTVSINVEDVDEGQRIFTELSDGGTVTMPYQKTFWSKGFGMFTDRYGTPWMVNCAV